jgi:hypothetical protein
MNGSDASTAPPPADKASTQAVTALILGVLGLACCQFLSPIAWFLGRQELLAIREGRSPTAGEPIASVARALGIAGTILIFLIIAWIVFFGGLAFLSALANHHS